MQTVTSRDGTVIAYEAAGGGDFQPYAPPREVEALSLYEPPFILAGFLQAMAR